MNDPRNPLNITTWTRGTWLGLVLLLLFAIGAIIAYLLAGVIGWSGATQGLVALLLGPLFGIVIFFAGWTLWKPNWNTVQPPAPQPRDASQIDPSQRSEARTIIDPAE